LESGQANSRCACKTGRPGDHPLHILSHLREREKTTWSARAVFDFKFLPPLPLRERAGERGQANSKVCYCATADLNVSTFPDMRFLIQSASHHSMG
jgi:hypothetical protein